jgi:hypothetical protein
MIEILTGISLWELVKHTGSWLVNLKRAKNARKQESIDALRKVVIAARRTSVYMRQLQETGKRSHETEAELAVLWTELGFALQDLGVTKLAKRCYIKGRQWADPSRFDKEFLEKADVGLEKMEQLANEVLLEVNS